MAIDIERAAAFLTGHGRVLDRRRFALLTRPGDARAAAVHAALDGYRNPDGGYGWGLEPDLRAPESQPAGALHALEAIAEAGPEVPPHTGRLFDWLHGVSLPDGGLPFALPIAEATGCAPFWAEARADASSLQITAAVVAHAHRVARHDERLRAHPWLAAATRYCHTAIGELTEAPPAHVLLFALRFVDAIADSHPAAGDLLAQLARFVPADGALPVTGGAEGETLHLLDLAPEPGRPVRTLLDEHAVTADLDRLAHGQQADGGWAVDFDSHSPAATLEWRGYTTVNAVRILLAHGR